MNAVMGNLASAVEFIKNFINMIKEFFASLFGGENDTAEE